MVLTHLCCREISDSPNVCPSGFKNATLLGVITLHNRPPPNSVVYQTNLYFSFSHIYGSSRDDLLQAPKWLWDGSTYLVLSLDH